MGKLSVWGRNRKTMTNDFFDLRYRELRAYLEMKLMSTNVIELRLYSQTYEYHRCEIFLLDIQFIL